VLNQKSIAQHYDVIPFYTADTAAHESRVHK